MVVKDFAEGNSMEILAGSKNIEKNNISGVCICDLLSWVMSHANRGDAWITVHTHLNIVAVAVLTEVSCIVIPEGIKVEQPTLNKADEEGIVIIGTDLSAYEICCKAYKCGI